MTSKVPCYLRTLRREWNLSQRELARLLPRSGRNRISLVERGARSPNSSELFGYALIFGISPRRVFPRFVEELEDEILRRAWKELERLQKEESPSAAAKIALLEGLPSRAGDIDVEEV